MLVIHDPEYLDLVRDFAKSMGLEQQLQQKLDYLAEYGDGNNTCKLGKDFAPHSFIFTMFRDGSYWFNGGLIYQGPDCPADGSFPSFTVSLAKRTGWFVHT